jgi:hypothetical protein
MSSIAVLPGPKALHLLCRTLTDPDSRKTAEFLKERVKYLVLASSLASWPELIAILKRCASSHLRVLVSWGTPFQKLLAMPEIFPSSNFAPSRLSVMTQGPECPWSLPIFHDFTHLELINEILRDEWMDWNQLQHLPNLTHLSFCCGLRQSG